MKKYSLFIAFFLLLTACGNNVQPPTLEERILEAEQQASTETSDSPDAQPPESAEAPKLTLNDPDQSFEQYLPILMFHYIEDVPADSTDQMRYGLSFSPQRLEEFLKYFKENNIQTLTFWDLIPIINGEKPFPEKAVMLTFDDGYDDHYTEAFRLLKEYDMKGVFYIISGKPDNDAEYATWAQIQEMAEQGQEIGSHTISHPTLTTLSSEALKKELEESKKVLEEKIGKPIISLCYPGGDYDQVVLEEAKKHYIFARTTEAGKNFSLQQRYELPTVRIFPETGVASLRAWFE